MAQRAGRIEQSRGSVLPEQDLRGTAFEAEGQENKMQGLRREAM